MIRTSTSLFLNEPPPRSSRPRRAFSIVIDILQELCHHVSNSCTAQAFCLEGTQHRTVSAPHLASYPPRSSPLTRRLSYHRLPIVRPVPGERQPPIRTQARSATILPNFVGLKFQVHNGKVYYDVTITEDMVGHKLGEFAP